MKLDRYHIGEVIGIGAFATVYEGEDPRLQSPVAVKVLADNWCQDPSVRFRFGQEAALLRRIKNERRDAPLVDVFDIDEASGGRPYFVMTFADRGTLDDRLVPGQPLDTVDVMTVVDALADGMAALHQSGVVHRDLKPSNMLFVSAGGQGDQEHLLIGDLGLAKDQLTSNSALTVAGGSPGYMAPEQQVATTEVTAQADIYSASVIVQQALTGTRDPAGRKDLAPDLAQILDKGTATVPSERHVTAEVWANELKAVLLGSETSADGSVEIAAGNEPRRSSQGSYFAAALVLTLLVLGGALVLFSGLLPVGTSRPASIQIEGPTTAMVGEAVVFVADVPEDGTHTWMVGDQSVSDNELLVTPRSPGTLEIRLEYESPEGEVAEVVHVVEVG